MPNSISESSLLFRFSSVLACWMVLADVSSSVDWSGSIFSDRLPFMKLNLSPFLSTSSALVGIASLWGLLRLLDYFCSHDDYFWERWLLELLVRILLVLVYLGSQALRQNYNSTSSIPASSPQVTRRTCCRPSCAILASPCAISILLAFSLIAVSTTLHWVGKSVPLGWPRASLSLCAGRDEYRSLRLHLRESGRR